MIDPSVRDPRRRSSAVGPCVAFAVAALAATPADACRPVAAEFIEGRVIVLYPTATGHTLRLLSDTGGGGSILSLGAAHRIDLGLETPPLELAAELGPEARLGSPPEPGAAVKGMPAPLLVLPRVTPVDDWPEALDGVLGQSWFAGGRWTWDYVAETLAADCEPTGTRVPIDLPPADAPAPARQFPAITITVAGEPVSMLFDSGATTWLTDRALQTIDDGGGVIRSTSMITASRVAAWREQHPDWRVIEAGQRGTRANMIEARDVVIAGLEIGPVWFTERPDRNFTEMMSAMMAKPVEGALGANAFRGLRVTLDYPASAAWFEQATGRSDPKNQ